MSLVNIRVKFQLYTITALTFILLKAHDYKESDLGWAKCTTLA